MNAPLRRLAGVIALMFASLLISVTWVQVVEADSLNNRPGNARALFKQFGRDRGPILVAGSPVAESVRVNDPYRFQRTYPGGAIYSNLTGYYSVVYGTTQLEATEDELLSGTADRLFYTRIGQLLTGDQPQGASVELTINPRVQQVAWNAMQGMRGAVVALNPQTGDVIAMVSTPGYDPALMAEHDTTKVRANRAKLLADPNRPLDNRAIAGTQYPPGSVFKLVTAATALSSGKFTPDSVLPGPAELPLPGTTTTLPNDFPGACTPSGTITMADALRISCNTAFGSLGMQVGDDALRAQADKFGFGQDLSIPLPVTPSFFPAQASAAETAQCAIGQFDVRVTPLQIAMITSAIANHGVLMRPNLIRTVRAGSNLEVIDRPTPQRFGSPISAQVASQLTQMMTQVVDAGTGVRAQISGVEVAGKTGTAQHGVDQPPHAWFTSFAPAENPQVAVAVVVEDGGGLGDAASGGRVAAPIAKQVMEAVIHP